jgi:hypothetical protein
MKEKATMKFPKSDLRHEDAALLGYRNELDPQIAEHYERGLGRKGRGKPIPEANRARAVEAAIKYLRSEWPSVIHKIEADALRSRA